MRVAVVQTDPRLGAVAENLEGILAGLHAAAADLVVFPECALTGYAFASRAAAWEVAQPIPGKATDAVAAACARTGAHVVFGLLERDAAGRLHNAAALVGPDGVVGVHRKAHRIHLGVDRFTDLGDALQVFDTPVGRLGILICFDLSFPEAARALKLRGAQVLLVPTNWPRQAEVSCVHAPPARAQENHVFVVTADRVGAEGGFTFRGESRVLDCEGRVLAVAGAEPGIVAAEIEPAAADANRVVHVAGEYEIDRLAARRPELYAPLTSS